MQARQLVRRLGVGDVNEDRFAVGRKHRVVVPAPRLTAANDATTFPLASSMRCTP